MLRTSLVVLCVACLAGCESWNSNNDNDRDQTHHDQQRVSQNDWNRNGQATHDMTMEGTDRSAEAQHGWQMSDANNASQVGMGDAQAASDRQGPMNARPANTDPNADPTRGRPQDRTLGWNNRDDNNAVTQDRQGREASAKQESRTYEASEQGAKATAQAVAFDDKDFVNKAASAGLFEVKSSELAKQKSQNSMIDQFADRLITDHNKANHDLMALAARKDWNVPSSMAPKEQECYDRLNSASGSDFERQYLQEQVKAHKEAVALFEAASSSAKDNDLKSFAQQYLPALRDHLKMAEDRTANMGQ